MQIELDENDGLLPEYDLDFSKSKPNCFAEKYNQTKRMVALDSDVAKDYPNSESVNEALRFLSRITKQHKAEIPH